MEWTHIYKAFDGQEYPCMILGPNKDETLHRIRIMNRNGQTSEGFASHQSVRLRLEVLGWEHCTQDRARAKVLGYDI